MKKICLGLSLLILGVSTYLVYQNIALFPLKAENASVKALVAQAKEYFEKKEYQSAIINLSQAITINPKYADAYYYLGLVYLKYNDNRVVKELPLSNCFNQEQQLFCTQMSISEKVQENRETAMTNFSKAIELNPDYVEAYYQRGLIQTSLAAQLEDLYQALNINTSRENEQLRLENYALASTYFENSLEISQKIDQRLQRISKEGEIDGQSTVGYSSITPLKRKNIQQICEVANRLVKQGNLKLGQEKYKEAALILQDNKNLKEYQKIVTIINQIDQTISKK